MINILRIFCEIAICRVPTASCESKLRTFQGHFQDQSRCYNGRYGKFHNADMLKIHHLKIQKRIPRNCSEMPIPLNWIFFALWMQISKTYLFKRTGCLQDWPYNIWQSDIHWSILNKANLRDLIAATGLIILLKLDLNHQFFSRCDLEIWWMTQKIGHLFYATLSFLHHFLAIGEYKLELHSGNA